MSSPNASRPLSTSLAEDADVAAGGAAGGATDELAGAAALPLPNDLSEEYDTESHLSQENLSLYDSSERDSQSEQEEDFNQQEDDPETLKDDKAFMMSSERASSSRTLMPCSGVKNFLADFKPKAELRFIKSSKSVNKYKSRQFSKNGPPVVPSDMEGAWSLESYPSRSNARGNDERSSSDVEPPIQPLSTKMLRNFDNQNHFNPAELVERYFKNLPKEGFGVYLLGEKRRVDSTDNSAETQDSASEKEKDVDNTFLGTPEKKPY